VDDVRAAALPITLDVLEEIDALKQAEPEPLEAWTAYQHVKSLSEAFYWPCGQAASFLGLLAGKFSRQRRQQTMRKALVRCAAVCIKAIIDLGLERESEEEVQRERS
jgi:hypothetical protein